MGELQEARPLVAFEAGLESVLRAPVYPVGMEPFSLSDLTEEATTYGKVEQSELEGGLTFTYSPPNLPGVSVEVWCDIGDDNRFVVVGGLTLSCQNGEELLVSSELDDSGDSASVAINVVMGGEISSSLEFDIKPFLDSVVPRLTVATLAMQFFNEAEAVAA